MSSSTSTFILVLHTLSSLLWAPQSLLLPKGQSHPLTSKGPLMTIPDQHASLHADTVSALHIWHLAFSTQYHRMTFCGYDKHNKHTHTHISCFTVHYQAQGGLFVNYLSIIVILISIFKVKLSARVNAEILKLKRAELRCQALEKHPLLCPPSASLLSPSQLC